MPDPIAPSPADRRYRDDYDDLPRPRDADRKTALANVHAPTILLGDARLEDVLAGRAVATPPPTLAPEAFKSPWLIDPKDPALLRQLHTELAQLGDKTPCLPGDTVASLTSRKELLLTQRTRERIDAEEGIVRMDDSGRQGTSAQLRAGDVRDRVALANPGSGTGILFAGLASARGASRDEIAAAGELGNLGEGLGGGLGAVVDDARRAKTEPQLHGADDRAVAADEAVKEVNGRKPMNGRLAWRSYPAEKLPETLRLKYPMGVRFKFNGFPDFEPYAIASVRVKGLTGDNTLDGRLASTAAGFRGAPDGYTWHHVEDGETMLLIPSDIHEAVRHTGGAAVIRAKQREKP